VISGGSLDITWRTNQTDTQNWSLYLQVFNTTGKRRFRVSFKNETTSDALRYKVTIPPSAQGCARLVASTGPHLRSSSIGYTNEFYVQGESDASQTSQATNSSHVCTFVSSVPSLNSTELPSTNISAPTSSQSAAGDPASSQPTAGDPTPSEGPRVTSAPTNQPESKSKSKSKIPIIVGATVGALVFLIGAVVLVGFIQWRRRRSSSPRQIVFNRELMFQRRPSPDDAKGWTVRSVDAEKGITNDGAQVFVPKTFTEESSL